MFTAINVTCKWLLLEPLVCRVYVFFFLQSINSDTVQFLTLHMLQVLRCSCRADVKAARQMFEEDVAFCYLDSGSCQFGLLPSLILFVNWCFVICLDAVWTIQI